MSRVLVNDRLVVAKGDNNYSDISYLYDSKYEIDATGYRDLFNKYLVFFIFVYQNF
jgi:hypothetical protein